MVKCETQIHDDSFNEMVVQNDWKWTAQWMEVEEYNIKIVCIIKYKRHFGKFLKALR